MQYFEFVQHNSHIGLLFSQSEMLPVICYTIAVHVVTVVQTIGLLRLKSDQSKVSSSAQHVFMLPQGEKGGREGAGLPWSVNMHICKFTACRS